ncbi:hypothetical protein Hanom_Chr14g01256431 [Helianthus anomalus]
MNTETKKYLEFKSLIGEAKDINILNNLKEHLSGIKEEGIKLKYLGGPKVLLCFNCPEEAEEFPCQKVNEWEKWFSRFYVWKGIPPIFERVAWIKILGVRVSLWDRNSEAEANDGNMVDDRLAILVQTGKRISSEFNLTWKGQIIKVWVEEISGQWCLAFLEDEDSRLGSPERSSLVGISLISGHTETKGCMSDSSHTCMGNPMGFSSTIPEENFQGRGMHGDQESPFNCINEERESVGPECQNYDKGANTESLQGQLHQKSAKHVIKPNV